MSKQITLCVLILLIACAHNAMSAKFACNNLPLSVSSVDICEDGICTVKQLVQTKIDLAAGKSTCFRLDTDELDIAKKVVNITIVDSWVSRPVRDCYTTDDPQITIEGFCRCRLAGSVDCSHCSNIQLLSNDTICVDGSNRGTGCIGMGTHCVKAAFLGGSRWKVCDIGKPSIFVDLLIYNSVEYISVQKELEEDLTIKDSEFSITFYDIDTPEDLRDKRLILDLLNPSFMYLAPDSQVNSIHSRDPDRIGWYRANETVTPKIEQLITVNVIDCADDVFAFGIGVNNIRESLADNPEWFLENKVPGAIWLDVDAEFVQFRPPIYNPPLSQLDQGSYFLTTSGEAFCLGLLEGNIPCQNGAYSPCDNLVGQTCDDPLIVYTNYDNCNVTNGDCLFTCSEWFVTYDGPVDYTSPPWSNSGETMTCANTRWTSMVRQCNAIHGSATPTNPVQWAIQTVSRWNDSDPTTTGDYWCDGQEEFIQADAYVYGIQWPSNKLGYWHLERWNAQGWNDTGERFWFVDTGDSMFSVQMFNLTSDHIITGNVVEKSKLDVEFKNVKVTFLIENVKPEFDSLKEDEEFIKVWAHSKGAEGPCLLSVSDDVAPSVMIDLKFKSQEFKTPLKIDKFKGDIVVEIRCYKNVAKAKTEVEIDRGGTDYNYNTIKPEELREMKMNDDLWDKAAKGAQKTGNALSSFFSRMYNLTGNAIADFFLGIFLSILFFIACVIAILCLYWGIRMCMGYSVHRYQMVRRNYTKSTLIGSLKKN